jgi:hypothetical protein
MTYNLTNDEIEAFLVERGFYNSLNEFIRLFLIAPAAEAIAGLG